MNRWGGGGGGGGRARGEAGTVSGWVGGRDRESKRGWEGETRTVS